VNGAPEWRSQHGGKFQPQFNSHKDNTMKAKKFDAVEVCKEFEDVLAPRLKLMMLDRAVYLHLLRHSRFEGKLRLRFSVAWLAKNMGITRRRVRQAVRRLVDKGILRLIERSNAGHLVEVRLPAEVRTAVAKQAAAGGTLAPLSASRAKLPSGANLEELDFMRSRKLRQAIHAREGGLCFYCLRLTPSRAHCLDHVVPEAESGGNSYRNLVSCCMDCNSWKRDLSAADFLRRLFREGRLSAKELSARLHAVHALAAGKLRPKISNGEEAGE
jgi:predicted transcriptional regulator